MDVFTASTHDYLLFFTDTGKVYRKGLPDPGERQDCQRHQHRQYPAGGAGGEDPDHAPLPGGAGEGQLPLHDHPQRATVKRLPVESAEESPQQRHPGADAGRGRRAHQRAGDRRQPAHPHCHPRRSGGVLRRDGRACHGPCTAVGVRGIRLRGDYVVGAARAEAGKTVLSITERGYGKRTPVEEYRITSRGGLGIRNYMVTEKDRPHCGHQGGGRTGGPAADDAGGYPDPHGGGQHPHRRPGHAGALSSCAFKEEGRPRHLHGAGGPGGRRKPPPAEGISHGEEKRSSTAP